MPFLPFIPFLNCAEVVVEGQAAGQAAFITLGARFGGAIVGTALQDLADAVAGWVTTNLLPNLHAGLTINQIKATDLTTQFSPVVFSTVGLPASGSVGGAALTNQNAFVESFATLSRGRSNRGRVYVPGIPPGSLASTTTYSALFVAAMNTVFLALPTALSGVGWTHVILSRQENGIRRTIGQATVVTAYLGRVGVGTQRRRVIGHGI